MGTPAAREQIAAAGRALPLLTHAFAHLAIETRLELACAHLALGDAPVAKDLLAEADQLLRGGCDFGSLHEDAGELSATVEQVRAASASIPKLTPAELRLLPLLATQLSFREIAEQLFISAHTVAGGGEPVDLLEGPGDVVTGMRCSPSSWARGDRPGRRLC